jgi:hypothetical protein
MSMLPFSNASTRVEVTLVGRHSTFLTGVLETMQKDFVLDERRLVIRVAG